MGFPEAVPRLLPNLVFLLAHLRRLSWLLGAGINHPKNSDLADHHHHQRQYHDDHGLKELEEHCPAMRFDELSVSNAGNSAGTPILPEGCVVCLSDFHGAARVRRPRGCQHVFHFGCLDRWAAHGHRICPFCRAPLLPPFLLPMSFRTS
ncbi:probable E3 ubiquitin-protein ligase RHA1A [Triticum urartu]|uniref:probable E3 ubiquitin-protein ligase RHA1A n=1 Tax=Triticum urartu TaxID=4572 RepID=UPI002042E30A|nr:probable E3 ubiquitin-protein ligase RHA1A [Triticum urartu]